MRDQLKKMVAILNLGYLIKISSSFAFAFVLSAAACLGGVLLFDA